MDPAAAKLILDALNRRFDEMEARWDRLFSPRPTMEPHEAVEELREDVLQQRDVQEGCVPALSSSETATRSSPTVQAASSDASASRPGIFSASATEASKLLQHARGRNTDEVQFLLPGTTIQKKRVEQPVAECSRVLDACADPERRPAIVRAEGLSASSRVFVGINLESGDLALYHSVHMEELLVANATAAGESKPRAAAISHILFGADDPGLLHCVRHYDSSLDDDPPSGIAHFDVPHDPAVGRVGQALAAAAALRADAVGAAGGGQLACVVAAGAAQTSCSTICPAHDCNVADVPVGALWEEMRHWNDGNHAMARLSYVAKFELCSLSAYVELQDAADSRNIFHAASDVPSATFFLSLDFAKQSAPCNMAASVPSSASATMMSGAFVLTSQLLLDDLSAPRPLRLPRSRRAPPCHRLRHAPLRRRPQCTPPRPWRLAHAEHPRVGRLRRTICLRHRWRHAAHAREGGVRAHPQGPQQAEEEHTEHRQHRRLDPAGGDARFAGLAHPKLRGDTCSTTCLDPPAAAVRHAIHVRDDVLLDTPEVLAEHIARENFAKAYALVLASRLPRLDDFVKDAGSCLYTSANCLTQVPKSSNNYGTSCILHTIGIPDHYSLGAVMPEFLTAAVEDPVSPCAALTVDSGAILINAAFLDAVPSFGCVVSIAAGVDHLGYGLCARRCIVVYQVRIDGSCAASGEPRQCCVVPASDGGAGLGDSEVERDRRHARAAVPAQVMRSQDLPPLHQGRQHAAGRTPRSRQERLQPRCAAVTTAVRGTAGHIAPISISTGPTSEKTNNILLLSFVTRQPHAQAREDLRRPAQSEGRSTGLVNTNSSPITATA